MSNTIIQLKYSASTSTPASLQPGESAYSFASGNLFIGNTTNSPIIIGGKYYTDIIENATNLNTSGQLVKRDGSGNFSANIITADLYGNSNTSTKLQTARNFGIDGDDITAANISFDGSNAVILSGSLKTTGVAAGTYGGSSNIPVFTVDAKGRITSATNTSITVPTNLSVAGDSGTGTLALSTDTLTVNGRDGITTQFIDANNSVLIDLDNTVIRTTGNQTITGDLSIAGNLTISGNTTQINVATLNVSDPLIYLAGNNYTSDIVDIGFVGNYYDGATQRHAGFARHAGDGKFYAFYNYDKEPDNNVIDVTDASIKRANIVANFIDGTISNLASDLSVVDGGTGASSFTNGQILIGQGSSALTTLANVTALTETVDAANTLNSFTTDTYGRVTAFTQQAIAIGTSQITSGTLPIARGGTNQTSFNTGERIYFNGTALASLANVTQTITGGLSTGNTITSITFDPQSGGISAYTGAKIALDASQITSGTLGVSRGGTGNTSLQLNSVLIGQGTSAITTLASSTEGHVLQIDSSGVPTFAMLSGGTF